MKYGDREGTLNSDHFLANIALDENLPGGLTAVMRDPRKQRVKPAAYVGKIEEVAATCRLVKPGDKVVFERWDYDQFDVDDERIIARENQLLILDGETPAPGVIVFKLVDQSTPKTTLALPPGVDHKKLNTYCGMVLASAVDKYEPGEMLWFQKGDMGQFMYADGRMAFRDNGYADILMRGWTAEYQDYKREQLGLSEEDFESFMKKMGFQSL